MQSSARVQVECGLAFRPYLLPSNVLVQSTSSKAVQPHAVAVLGCSEPPHRHPSTFLSHCSGLLWMPLAHETSGRWHLVKHPGCGHPFQPRVLPKLQNPWDPKWSSFPLLSIPKLCHDPHCDIESDVSAPPCGTKATMKTALSAGVLVCFSSQGSGSIIGYDQGQEATQPSLCISSFPSAQLPASVSKSPSHSPLSPFLKLAGPRPQTSSGDPKVTP